MWVYWCAEILVWRYQQFSSDGLWFHGVFTWVEKNDQLKNFDNGAQIDEDKGMRSWQEWLFLSLTAIEDHCYVQLPTSLSDYRFYNIESRSNTTAGGRRKYSFQKDLKLHVNYCHRTSNPCASSLSGKCVRLNVVIHWGTNAENAPKTDEISSKVMWGGNNVRCLPEGHV